MDPDHYLVHGTTYKVLREQLTELLMQKANVTRFQELLRVGTQQSYYQTMGIQNSM